LQRRRERGREPATTATTSATAAIRSARWANCSGGACVSSCGDGLICLPTRRTAMTATPAMATAVRRHA
jgi:hypothetical protein